MKIVGILNLTTDSFSDGRLYLETPAAIEKGLALAADGADLVDIGAQSSNPDGEMVTPKQEIERLTPVIEALKREGLRLSVDTYRAEVMEHVTALGVDMINDITALRDAAAAEVVRRAGVKVVLMFARNQDPHAQRTQRSHSTVMTEIETFFADRLSSLRQAGIDDARIIIDPGMGFFLGGNPEPSLMVLRHLDALRRFGRETYISTSRKSFIGKVLDRPVEARASGTLATEIWAYLQGIDYIRTHQPAALRDAVRILQAIQEIE